MTIDSGLRGEGSKLPAKKRGDLIAYRFRLDLAGG